VPVQIPNFAATAAGGQLFNITPCQTVLLFPYVTTYGTQAASGSIPTKYGWNTGVSIANTGADPFGTVSPTATGGACTLYFYSSTGAANNPPTVSTASAASGGTLTAGMSYAFSVTDPLNTGTVQSAYSGFSGYMFAVCNFSYAHGFAYVVSDGGFLLPTNTAMGYLADVVTGGGAGATFRPTALTGEGLMQ